MDGAAPGAGPDPLAALATMPGVAEEVERARDACTRLRWHPGLRRRSAQCRVEAGVRAVRCSAALDGARLPVDLVRDAFRGGRELPSDAAGLVVRGALRAHAESERLGADGARAVSAAPWQALARLQVAATAGLVEDAALGRPRADGEAPRDVPVGTPVPGGVELRARLLALSDLLAAPTAAPVLVRAAVAHAEVLTTRPFVAGNGVVARALARALVVGGGLDPTGVAVPEAAHLSDAAGYTAAWQGYASGTAAGAAAWLRHCARAVVDGAAEGSSVAAAVAGGRLPAG